MSALKKIPTVSLRRTVRILGIKYRIKYIPDLSEDGISLDGDICTTKKLIRVRTGMNEEHTNHTIVHECFHGVLSELGMHHTDLSENLEHIIVDNLSGFTAKTWKLKWKK